jgi:hypothetical protein
MSLRCSFRTMLFPIDKHASWNPDILRAVAGNYENTELDTRRTRPELDASLRLAAQHEHELSAFPGFWA